MAKNNLTMNLGLSLIAASLEEVGYDLIDLIDGYIYAQESDGNLPSIVVLPISRKLSLKVTNGKEVKETFQVLASHEAVKKIMKRAESEAGGFTPCIGFSISKYTYSDTETIVIPIAAWDDASNHSVTIKSKGFWYNYSQNSDLPCICRFFWNCNNVKNL